ncbi:MAG TPA: ABC transporter permease [Pseudomonadota bacterium]|nr:ABC transporter permease [Pseudomonadota bacterium]HNK45643.1 ABC transporter permease [Pseudomonadota bacterium]HNN52289.1 ABC transporter permease [Pseudomonadota bacterium]HNO68175.1 ABC transporter permease [Pseudomonadota bacterium]
MMFVMALRLALRSLLRNRMRSALTALGVIIGVAALLVTVVLGEGTRKMVAAQIATMGSAILMIVPGASAQGGFMGGTGSGRPLQRDDVEAILQARSVRYAVPVDRTIAQVISANLNWQTPLLGTTTEYAALRDWPVGRGRFFTSAENDTAAKVCVLGQTVAQNLFGDTDPVGQQIRVKQMLCEIIGVLTPKGQSAMGSDQDDILIMPSLTLRTRVLNQNRQFVSTIMVAATSEDDLAAAESEVVSILRQRHKLTDEQENDFTIRNLAELVQTQQKIVETQTGMLRNVAAVSLLVGGIGIMNIMLVSVTERTREIGIRLAIGARERDILLQFLVEAVVLSVLGGLLGIGLGVLMATLFSRFGGGMPVDFSPFWMVLGFGVSVAIGVLFGFYPARKAARLDPIDALRYE